MTLLLSVTIKMAALTLVALAATTALRRRSAAVRHWLLATTLVCCICLPALELVTPSWSIPLPGAWSTSATRSSLRLVSDSTGSPVAARAADDTSIDSSVRGRPSLTRLLVSLWVAGMVIGVAILMAGLWRLRTLAADATAVSTGLWCDVADEVSRRYGVRRSIRLRCCQHPTMLATWGLVNPTILLPAGAETWPADRVSAVLHHELAHILRGDWIVALAAHLLRAIYWFNPLLWIVCRRLRHESERACDDLVLTSGMSGAEYATHLLEVARESAQRRYPWSPAIAIAHRSMLERRVRAMLNARVNREPLTILGRVTTVAVLAAVTIFVGVVSLSGSTEAPVAPTVSATSSGTLPVPPAEPARVAEAVPVPAPVPAPAPEPAQAGQANGATIGGVLYDQFGGLLPGASVTLATVGSGGSQSTLTDRGGSFAFNGLAAGDYEVVTDLPGFTTVKNVIRVEPGATVRRHITLPLGTIQETILVTCSTATRATSRPTAPTASSSPGSTQSQATASPRGSEPKIPRTFTGGIGGQIKAPTKLRHVNPICPSLAAPETTVVLLAGRIGIDGLFTDLHDVSTDAQPAYVASALESARQWVFTPTLLNGAPIEVNISVTVRYSWN